MVVLVHAVPLLILDTTSAGGVLDLVIALVGSWVLGLALLRTWLSPWVASVDTLAAPLAPATTHNAPSRNRAATGEGQ